MATNLPAVPSTDGAKGTRLFFETYGDQPLEFPATEVSATIAFFTKRGFEESAAIITASTLLKQAKNEAQSIFKILDNLEGFTDIQISALVAQILNLKRVPSSTLGYKTTVPDISKTRNIAA